MMPAGNKLSVGLRRLAVWAALAFLLNSLWELAQLPLYAQWNDPVRIRIAIYLIHCILGDMLIATFLFLIVSVVLRNLNWTATQPWCGGALVISLGLAYTVVSEWYNVYEAKAWSYSPLMPLVGGIGIAPMLQWFVGPTLMIMAIRRLR